MRASVILVVVLGLFACSHALDLSAVTDNLKTIGANLVNNLLGSLKEKAVQIGKTLLGGLLDKFGKRELPLLGHLKTMATKLGELLHAGKNAATSVFGKALEHLKALADKFHAKLTSMSDAKQVSDAVDDVVAEHHVQQKRIISDLIQKGKDLLGSLVSGVKNALSALKGKASELVSNLLQKGTDVLVGKRTTLSEHLSNIGGAISSAVSPFKDIVAGLGNTLKGHFSNLVDTVKGHVTALKGKLSGHLADLNTHGSTLLQHGKNALGALGEVVSDILKQTLNNAKPAIDGLAKTLSSAGKVTLDHLAGSSSTF